MKKIFGITILAVCLSLALAGTAAAAPAATPTGGLFVFGEYAPAWLYAPEGFFQVGVGYSLGELLSVGGEIMFGDGDMQYGAFADLKLGPIAANAEVVMEGGFSVGKLTGLYLVDLEMVKVGGGAGMIFTSGGGQATFVEVVGSVDLMGISAYAKVDRYLDGPETTVFTVGGIYTF